MNRLKNWLNKELKYIGIAVVVGVVMTTSVAYATSGYANEVSDDIADSVLRLHIRANSDSPEDQGLKLKVRDTILEEFRGELTGAETKEELIDVIEDNHDRIIEVARKVIVENGYDYSVSSEVGEAYLETRKYGDIYLPAGTYDALIIKIGSGEGHNWWCVLYPPLCYVESTSVVSEKDKKVLKDNLTEDEYNIITKGGNMDVQFKFKVVEMFAD